MDHFILDGVEMNPEGLLQLYRHVKTQDTPAACEFEVTDEGEIGIQMNYQSTAALSCVNVVGAPSPCVSSCSLYQVRILYLQVTALCSEGPMFRRSYVQKVLCSEGPLFRRFYVQKVLCSEGSIFRRFYV